MPGIPKNQQQSRKYVQMHMHSKNDRNQRSPHLSLALRVFACVTYIKEFVLSCLSLFTFVFFLFLCYVVAFVRQHYKQNTAKRWESVKEKYLK